MVPRCFRFEHLRARKHPDVTYDASLPAFGLSDDVALLIVHHCHPRESTIAFSINVYKNLNHGGSGRIAAKGLAGIPMSNFELAGSCWWTQALSSGQGIKTNPQGRD